MAGKLLSCTFFVGDKQVEKLTPEDTERMADRVSKALSTYYTVHVDEFVKFKAEEA